MRGQSGVIVIGSAQETGHLRTKLGQRAVTGCARNAMFSAKPEGQAHKGQLQSVRIAFGIPHQVFCAIKKPLACVHITVE